MERLASYSHHEGSQKIFKMEKKLRRFIANNPWTKKERDYVGNGNGRYPGACAEAFFMEIFATQLEPIDTIPPELGLELRIQNQYFIPFDWRNKGSLRRGVLCASYISPLTNNRRIGLIYPLRDGHFLGHFFEQDADLVWHDAGGDHHMDVKTLFNAVIGKGFPVSQK